MNNESIIKKIALSKKKTPCKVTLKCYNDLHFPNAKVFKSLPLYIVYGDYEEIKETLMKNENDIEEMVIENHCRNSSLPLLNTLNINARIEPGAIIREDVEIKDNAVIMMGAIINIGAKIGEGSMIDMGAIIGARAIIGASCHIGAGAVLAGVIEPPSATPVIIEDNVLIGANAVIVEGVKVGKNSIVGAGAVVLQDVEEGVVVGGVPAKVIKKIDASSLRKKEIIPALRKLT
ncbi:MAG: 2,3,4,5-tetrahydropyridine-2,6-dicarboxylate N-acetyltransferase [Bacilli bacterium]